MVEVPIPMLLAFVGPFGAPSVPAFGGGASETLLNPIVLVVVSVAIALMLFLPRQRVMVPFLLATFLIPRGQQVFVAGMHWYMLRIIIIAGIVRLARERFKIAGGLNEIDKLFMVWAIARGLSPVLLVMQGGMLANQGAFWLEAFGGYFLLRHLIQSEDDIALTAQTLAILAAVLGAFMLNERAYNVNLFGYLGGAPLTPVVREGTIRAQATFGHPILAGTFGATLVPLHYWLWKVGRSKCLAILGIVGSTLMVVTSSSSTSLLAYLGGALALVLWPIRRYMRTLRWGIVLALVGLNFAMNAPVWYVLQYMNVIGASGGWDRGHLIDVFFKHFSDWWLFGTDQMANWGFDMWDLSNQFVAEGETGGVVTFVCFIAIIYRCFSRLGRMRKRPHTDKRQQWSYWILGAALLSHLFAFFGVSYWDATRIWWWALLAMVSAATSALQSAPPRALESGIKVIPVRNGVGWINQIGSNAHVNDVNC